MKTKRELLEYIAKYGRCVNISCIDCPCDDSKHCLHDDLRKIGAMTILRQNKKKFDPNKVLTCVTADKAKVGMKGYFGNTIKAVEFTFKHKEIFELLDVLPSDCEHIFSNLEDNYALFYPIDKEVEE